MVIYISHISISLIPAKHAKTSKPKDKHCVLQCTPIYAALYP